MVYTASHFPSHSRYDIEFRALKALSKIPCGEVNLFAPFPLIHDCVWSCACLTPMVGQCRAFPTVAKFLGVGRGFMVPPQRCRQRLVPCLPHPSYSALYTLYALIWLLSFCAREELQARSQFYHRKGKHNCSPWRVPKHCTALVDRLGSNVCPGPPGHPVSSNLTKEGLITQCRTLYSGFIPHFNWYASRLH